MSMSVAFRSTDVFVSCKKTAASPVSDAAE